MVKLPSNKNGETRHLLVEIYNDNSDIGLLEIVLNEIKTPGEFQVTIEGD